MVLTAVLLVVLVVPLVAWVVVRWWPAHRRSPRAPKLEDDAPRHRWWQP
jgi:hypothetical protein